MRHQSKNLYCNCCDFCVTLDWQLSQLCVGSLWSHSGHNPTSPDYDSSSTRTHRWTDVEAIASQNTQIKNLARLPLMLVIMCSLIYWIQLHIYLQIKL